jgi:hypothetical protein
VWAFLVSCDVPHCVRVGAASIMQPISQQSIKQYLIPVDLFQKQCASLYAVDADGTIIIGDDDPLPAAAQRSSLLSHPLISSTRTVSDNDKPQLAASIVAPLTRRRRINDDDDDDDGGGGGGGGGGGDKLMMTSPNHTANQSPATKIDALLPRNFSNNCSGYFAAITLFTNSPTAHVSALLESY